MVSRNKIWLHVMGRKPLNPAGPMTATERSKRRYALKSKFINQRRRRLYKEAKEAKERRHAGWPDVGLMSQ